VENEKVRKGGGKSKGASFERKVCELLSKWQSNGQDTSWYWRSAMSGGRATVAKKSGKLLQSQCGDITAIDPRGSQFLNKFFVECKHVKSYNLSSFLLYNTGVMAKDWETAVKQAKDYNKIPLFICNLSSLGIVAVMPSYMNFVGLQYCWKVIVPDSNLMVLLFKQLLDEWKWDQIICD
jgi:hypothetical protein